jgi:3-hydroxybutyryl-CoA dehydrogenase
MNDHIRGIAVIGAGIMGHGIAQVCAQTGKKVNVVDEAPEAIRSARSRIEQNVDMLRKHGLLLASQADAIMGNLNFTTRMEEAVDSVDVVFEAVSENVELKQRLFQRLDSICSSDVIYASNTSALPIQLLSSFSCNPARVIGTHFYNPAQLIPLVEVITSEATDPAVLCLVMEFLAAAGKKPIHLRKDIPGFIGNRLQSALAREAMSLVQTGIASPEDIDMVVKHSLALRLLFSGPLEQRDLNGLDTHLAITKTLYPVLEDAKEALQVLRDKVARGELGLKTGKGFYDWSKQAAAEVANRKNQQLIALLKFLRENSQDPETPAQTSDFGKRAGSA